MSHTLIVLAWVCWVAATITALAKRGDVALALIAAGLAFYITNPTFDSQVEREMVAGREVTPKDAASTERLMTYWAEGEGAAKIGWNSPGDYDRCVLELGKYVGPGVVHGLCQNLHQRATGFPAGKAPGDKA